MRRRFEDEKIETRQKSTKFQIIMMIIWMIIFVFLLLEVLKFVGYTLGKYDREEMFVYNTVDSLMQKIYPKKPSFQTEENKVNVAALGNIYLTPNMIKGAKNEQGYNFSTGLEKVKNKLKDYDVVIANLYTPIAGKDVGYSTTKLYNVPDEITITLKDLNISALATATYHAFDKKSDGISETIKKLDEFGIKQTGISNVKRSKPVVITKNNINIGILSYATKSNVKLNMDSESLNIFSEENVKADMQYLKEQNVDVILAYLDTYTTNVTMTDSVHKQNIDILFENGVNIILGAGVAAVQDDYEDVIDLENGKKQHVYTIYSLGDFMGGYTSEYAKAGIIPSFEISKSVTKNKNGEIKQTTVDFKVKQPLYVWTEVDKNYVKTMYFMLDEINNFNNDNLNLTAKEYNTMYEEYTRISNMYK